MIRISTNIFMALLVPASHAAEPLLEGKRTILFFGESITQAGDYVAAFDAWLLKKRGEGWHVVGLHSEMRAKLEKAACQAH